MTIPFPSAALAHLHASFLAIVLPRVLSHGRVCFGGIKCPHRREDAIQEMIGLAWQWHLRLAEKGKDATAFPTALASHAARAVRNGSRLIGQERANDVLSPVAQRRHRFYVGRLPDFETLTEHPISEALLDNTKSPPDETHWRSRGQSLGTVPRTIQDPRLDKPRTEHRDLHFSLALGQLVVKRF